jgi:hypothetical protein
MRHAHLIQDILKKEKKSCRALDHTQLPSARTLSLQPEFQRKTKKKTKNKTLSLHLASQ